MPINNNNSISDPLVFEERKSLSGGQLYSIDPANIGGENQLSNINMDYDGAGSLVTRVGTEYVSHQEFDRIAYYYDKTNPLIVLFDRNY